MKTKWTDSQNGCRSLAASVVAIIALQVTTLHATQWLVDGNRGNDQTGNGSLAAPWKTIQKAANTMAAGDACHIRGGTYREMVTPKPGQAFQNYNGEFVLITGRDLVPAEDWKLHAGNIYKATVSSPVYDVFVAGAYMDKARWPDSDGDPYNKAALLPHIYREKRFQLRPPTAHDRIVVSTRSTRKECCIHRLRTATPLPSSHGV